MTMSDAGEIMKRPTTALVFKPQRWKKRRRVLLERSITSEASTTPGEPMPTPAVGEKIKVSLPGESLWTEVTSVEDGKITAKLLNESIHEEFVWGDEVVVGDDGYTVAEPADKVASVQKASEDWHGSGRPTS